MNEYIVLDGKKLVIHSSNCKCSKRIRDSFCVYGLTREDILSDIPQGKKEGRQIDFAPCTNEALGQSQKA